MKNRVKQAACSSLSLLVGCSLRERGCRLPRFWKLLIWYIDWNVCVLVFLRKHNKINRNHYIKRRRQPGDGGLYIDKNRESVRGSQKDGRRETQRVERRDILLEEMLRRSEKGKEALSSWDVSWRGRLPGCFLCLSDLIGFTPASGSWAIIWQN